MEMVLFASAHPQKATLDCCCSTILSVNREGSVTVAKRAGKKINKVQNRSKLFVFILKQYLAFQELQKCLRRKDKSAHE
jgi:hypothetical protein